MSQCQSPASAKVCFQNKIQKIYLKHNLELILWNECNICVGSELQHLHSMGVFAICSHKTKNKQTVRIPGWLKFTLRIELLTFQFTFFRVFFIQRNSYSRLTATFLSKNIQCLMQLMQLHFWNFFPDTFLTSILDCTYHSLFMPLL